MSKKSPLARRPPAKSLSERLGKTPGVKKELHRSTRPLLLQKRRAELEGCRIRIEKLVAKFMDGKLTSEKRMELYLQAQMVGQLGIVKGLGLMTDMLSWESRKKIDGKDHLKRNSYLDVIWDRLDGIEDALYIKFSPEDKQRIAEARPDLNLGDIPEGVAAVQTTMSLDQKLDGIFDMVHEFCLRKDPAMFEVRDKNNIVITNDRYAELPGMMEGEDPSSSDDEGEDGDAVSEEELERMRKEAEAEEE